MCLAQGHNTVKLLRLEPLAPGSRVKHSTTVLVIDHFTLLISLLLYERSKTENNKYSASRNSVNNAFLRLFLYVQTNRTINIRI